MNRKSILATVSGLSALALAATCGPALAFGGHGHGHHGGDDGQFFLLAQAAGITGDQIHTAFKADTNLKTDIAAVRTAKTAVNACIIAGTCTSGSTGQVATLAAAQSTLTAEKLGVWQNLFATKGVNNAAAISLQTQLQALDTQKHTLIKQVFSSAKDSESTTPQTSPE
jgi:hypothetical protein